MEIKNLGDLAVELVAFKEDCVFLEKYNGIYFNDKKFKGFTVSVYQNKDGNFRVSVKVKGKKFEETSKSERKSCIEFKQDLVERLNAHGFYNFSDDVKPIQAAAPTTTPTTKIDDIDNPFGDLDSFNQ
ncbi:hypothetical protein [Aquitalea pelogenes]|uniref:hypothetical protein n=1 Tax=Aquitalea pelogenes TaxID=1293573 RepID=UPI0035B1F854